MIITVKFKCGHNERRELFGDIDKQLELYRTGKLCSKCIKKHDMEKLEEKYIQLEMDYNTYKLKYNHCKTLNGSYNKRNKTIVVLVEKE